MREVAIDTEGVKEIVRITVLVADFGDALECRGILNGLILICRKVCHYRERGSDIVAYVQDFPIAPHLIDSSVKHDHLSVKVVEGSKPEIAVVEQELAEDCFLVDSLDKSPRSRNLKQCVLRQAQALR
jgi:hypothetical protein